MSVCYNNIEDVKYNDVLFHMSQREEVWNKNITDGCNMAWINVLYKIIIEWFNKYATWFICIGHKPQTYVNEKKDICCDIIYILCREQILKGGDCRQQLSQTLYAELGAMRSWILNMCKPIFETG